MVIRVCHHSLISDFFDFSFFLENFRYINQGTGQKKMSEDVVQNVFVRLKRPIFYVCQTKCQDLVHFLKPVLKQQ